MTRFKVVEMPKNNQDSESLLNELSSQGWELVQVTQYQIFLKREETPSDEQYLLQD